MTVIINGCNYYVILLLSSEYVSKMSQVCLNKNLRNPYFESPTWKNNILKKTVDRY
jgi:hypothetical protein